MPSCGTLISKVRELLPTLDFRELSDLWEVLQKEFGCLDFTTKKLVGEEVNRFILEHSDEEFEDVMVHDTMEEDAQENSSDFAHSLKGGHAPAEEQWSIPETPPTQLRCLPDTWDWYNSKEEREIMDSLDKKHFKFVEPRNSLWLSKHVEESVPSLKEKEERCNDPQVQDDNDGKENPCRRSGPPRKCAGKKGPKKDPNSQEDEFVRAVRSLEQEVVGSQSLPLEVREAAIASRTKVVYIPSKCHPCYANDLPNISSSESSQRMLVAAKNLPAGTLLGLYFGKIMRESIHQQMVCQDPSGLRGVHDAYALTLNIFNGKMLNSLTDLGFKVDPKDDLIISGDPTSSRMTMTNSPKSWLDEEDKENKYVCRNKDCACNEYRNRVQNACSVHGVAKIDGVLHPTVLFLTTKDLAEGEEVLYDWDPAGDFFKTFREHCQTRNVIMNLEAAVHACVDEVAEDGLLRMQMEPLLKTMVDSILGGGDPVDSTRIREVAQSVRRLLPYYASEGFQKLKVCSQAIGLVQTVEDMKISGWRKTATMKHTHGGMKQTLQGLLHSLFSQQELDELGEQKTGEGLKILIGVSNDDEGLDALSERISNESSGMSYVDGRIGANCVEGSNARLCTRIDHAGSLNARLFTHVDRAEGSNARLLRQDERDNAAVLFAERTSVALDSRSPTPEASDPVARSIRVMQAWTAMHRDLKANKPARAGSGPKPTVRGSSSLGARKIRNILSSVRAAIRPELTGQGSGAFGKEYGNDPCRVSQARPAASRREPTEAASAPSEDEDLWEQSEHALLAQADSEPGTGREVAASPEEENEAARLWEISNDDLPARMGSQPQATEREAALLRESSNLMLPVVNAQPARTGFQPGFAGRGDGRATEGYGEAEAPVLTSDLSSSRAQVEEMDADVCESSPIPIPHVGPSSVHASHALDEYKAAAIHRRISAAAGNAGCTANVTDTVRLSLASARESLLDKLVVIHPHVSTTGQGVTPHTVLVPGTRASSQQPYIPGTYASPTLPQVSPAVTVQATGAVPASGQKRGVPSASPVQTPGAVPASGKRRGLPPGSPVQTPGIIPASENPSVPVARTSQKLSGIALADIPSVSVVQAPGVIGAIDSSSGPVSRASRKLSNVALSGLLAPPTSNPEEYRDVPTTTTSPEPSMLQHVHMNVGGTAVGNTVVQSPQHNINLTPSSTISPKLGQINRMTSREKHPGSTIHPLEGENRAVASVPLSSYISPLEGEYRPLVLAAAGSAVPLLERERSAIAHRKATPSSPEPPLNGENSAIACRDTPPGSPVRRLDDNDDSDVLSQDDSMRVPALRVEPNRSSIEDILAERKPISHVHGSTESLSPLQNVEDSPLTLPPSNVFVDGLLAECQQPMSHVHRSADRSLLRNILPTASVQLPSRLTDSPLSAEVRTRRDSSVGQEEHSLEGFQLIEGRHPSCSARLASHLIDSSLSVEVPAQHVPSISHELRSAEGLQPLGDRPPCPSPQLHSNLIDSSLSAEAPISQGEGLHNLRDLSPSLSSRLPSHLTDSSLSAEKPVRREQPISHGRRSTEGRSSLQSRPLDQYTRPPLNLDYLSPGVGRAAERERPISHITRPGADITPPPELTMSHVEHSPEVLSPLRSTPACGATRPSVEPSGTSLTDEVHRGRFTSAAVPTPLLTTDLTDRRPSGGLRRSAEGLGQPTVKRTRVSEVEEIIDLTLDD